MSALLKGGRTEGREESEGVGVHGGTMPAVTGGSRTMMAASLTAVALHRPRNGEFRFGRNLASVADVASGRSTDELERNAQPVSDPDAHSVRVAARTRGPP